MLTGIKNRIGFLAWVLIAILTVEIYYVLIQALDMINTGGAIQSGELKGITANRNITAFSLAIKLPFVYYLIHKHKKLFSCILSYIIFLSHLSAKS